MNHCIVCNRNLDRLQQSKKMCFGGCTTVRFIPKKNDWHINDSRMEIHHSAKEDMRMLAQGVFVVDKLKLN